MTAEEKTSIAGQVRHFLATMRSIPPPSPQHIGSCGVDGHARDTRAHQKYFGPNCVDEAAFNEYLIGAIPKSLAVTLKKALEEQLRTDHRVVFTHGDLAPRNIMVSEEGKVTGVIDWEDAGWYPAYWEYVKFFPAQLDA